MCTGVIRPYPDTEALNWMCKPVVFQTTEKLDSVINSEAAFVYL